MKPLTIVHIAHAFLPHHRHGAELSTFEMASRQQQEGHRVIVLAGEKGRNGSEVLIRRWDVGDLEVWRIYFHPRSRNGFISHSGLYDALTVKLQALAPDIVHIQDLTTLSLSAIHAAADLEIPILFTLRNYTLFCARGDLVRGDGSTCLSSNLVSDCAACLQQRNPRAPGIGISTLLDAAARNITSARRWGQLTDQVLGKLTGEQPLLSLRSEEGLRARNDKVKEALARVNILIAQNEDFARRFLAFLGLPEDAITVVQHTRDLAAFHHRVRNGVNPPYQIGYVGKIAWHKGLHVLIDALRKLPNGLFRTHVYGAPSWTNLHEVAYFKAMRTRSSRLDVTFHGNFSPKDAPAIYDGLDLFVMPSVWPDCNPGVILEAQASGCPVLTSDVGGGTILVKDGENGVHFHIGDGDDLAKKLLDLSYAPSEIERMSGSKPSIRTMDNYAAEIMSLYASLL